MPEPAVEVDQDDDEDPSHVTGEHGGPGIEVGAERWADRLEPGVERRLKRHRLERAGLVHRLHVHDGRDLVDDQAVEHRQPAQAPPGAGGLRSQLLSAEAPVVPPPARPRERTSPTEVRGAPGAAPG